MKLSSRGDYAVRLVLEMSLAGEGAVLTVAELGQRIGVPSRYLAHLLAELRTRGIVQSSRGAQGGFTLGRPPGAITVGEVVRTMDGPLAPIPCASRTAHIPCPPQRCAVEEGCVLRSLWLEVRDAIAAVVDHTTFADLAARSRAGMSATPARYTI